jgi:hypothetical protein
MSQSIQIKPIHVDPALGLRQQGPLAGVNSPDALRAKCVIQRDVNACRQLQEALVNIQENQWVDNVSQSLPPVQTQQFNQRLQAKNIPEEMRVKCLVEFNLGVCKEIDEMLASKKAISNSAQ